MDNSSSLPSWTSEADLAKLVATEGGLSEVPVSIQRATALLLEGASTPQEEEDAASVLARALFKSVGESQVKCPIMVPLLAINFLLEWIDRHYSVVPIVRQR